MKKLSFESEKIKVSLEYDADVTEQDKSEILLLLQNLLKVTEVKEETSLLDGVLGDGTLEALKMQDALPLEDIKVSKVRISIPAREINNQILFILQRDKVKCSPSLLGKPRVPVVLSDVPPAMFKPHSSKRPNKWYQKAYGSLYYQEERRRGYK